MRASRARRRLQEEQAGPPSGHPRRVGEGEAGVERSLVLGTEANKIMLETEGGEGTGGHFG